MKALSIVAIVASLVLSGCAIKPATPICTANYMMGGNEYTAQVYDVKKENGQTLFKAGHPFNFRYTSVSNFTSNTCL